MLFVHYCNMMVCVVYCVGKWQWLGQFNFRIGIAAQFPFRNWNWNWWNWKWNLNWKLWNWNWKQELIVLQLLPKQWQWNGMTMKMKMKYLKKISHWLHLLVNQQFPNFSFNRGHNLPCDWLLMQQCCFKFLEHWPLQCGHKRHTGRVPCSHWVDNSQKD